jgi:hypothetical protein
VIRARQVFELVAACAAGVLEQGHADILVDGLLAAAGSSADELSTADRP